MGIFVNGAYALQFTDEFERGLLGSFEGILVMLFAILIKKKDREMNGQDLVLILGGILCVWLGIWYFKILKNNSHFKAKV